MGRPFWMNNSIPAVGLNLPLNEQFNYLANEPDTTYWYNDNPGSTYPITDIVDGSHLDFKDRQISTTENYSLYTYSTLQSGIRKLNETQGFVEYGYGDGTGDNYVKLQLYAGRSGLFAKLMSSKDGSSTFVEVEVGGFDPFGVINYFEIIWSATRIDLVINGIYELAITDTSKIPNSVLYINIITNPRIAPIDMGYMDYITVVIP